ncbi:MAG: hypothetical protein Q8P06_01160 [Candidatus Azambacteria bacterium]|nr:hypothetical protein [Candidatus Azambacteria bacterium]
MYKCNSCGKEAEEKETCCEAEMQEKTAEVNAEGSAEANTEDSASDL